MSADPAEAVFAPLDYMCGDGYGNGIGFGFGTGDGFGCGHGDWIGNGYGNGESGFGVDNGDGGRISPDSSYYDFGCDGSGDGGGVAAFIY